MRDIVSITTDIGLFDAQTPKAANVLSVQVGALEYAPEFGIDLAYFLSEDFSFQNESFKSYLIQVLANNSINVASITDLLEDLYANYIFKIIPKQTTDSLIAR